MITKLNNKPIKYVYSHCDLKLIDKVNYPFTYFSTTSGQPYMYNDESSNVLGLINKNIKPSLDDGSVLYFTKTSKFPRLKLNNTDFKRTTKFEKADASVINSKYGTYVPIGSFFLFETESFYFAFGIYQRKRYADNQIYRDDPVAYINANVKFVANLNPIYIGQGNIFCTKMPEIVDILLSGKEVALIEDDKLDKIISKSYEKLTKEMFYSIKDMVQSTDLQVVGLGLKMLGMYDLTDVTSAIYTLLRLNYSRVSSAAEWNSTTVKQVRNTVGIFNQRIYRSYFHFEPVFAQAKSVLDLEICTELLLEYIKQRVEKEKIAGEEALGFKIKCELCRI